MTSYKIGQMGDGFRTPKARPNFFDRMMEHAPSPVKVVAIPLLLIAAIGINSCQLVNSKVESRKQDIAAYVKATQSTADDGILLNEQELDGLARVTLKLKLTPAEVDSLISMTNKLNNSADFAVNKITAQWFIETINSNSKFITREQNWMEKVAMANQTLSNWKDATKIEDNAEVRMGAVMGKFNACAGDTLKVKMIEGRLDKKTAAP